MKKYIFSPPNTVALIHHIWNLGGKKKNQTGGCVSRFAVLNSSGATEGPDLSSFRFCCPLTVAHGVVFTQVRGNGVLVKDQREN